MIVNRSSCTQRHRTPVIHSANVGGGGEGRVSFVAVFCFSSIIGSERMCCCVHFPVVLSIEEVDGSSFKMRECWSQI